MKQEMKEQVDEQKAYYEKLINDQIKQVFILERTIFKSI